jgi:hypothetical protein
MTPRIDWLRIAVWFVIVLSGLVVLGAVTSLALAVGEIIIPPVWAFVQAHADGLAALVALAMVAIVGVGVMEA